MSRGAGGELPLYLMVSTKATMIFSPRYKEIVAATPHVKAKTSPIVWALLIILILLILVIVFASLYGTSV